MNTIFHNGSDTMTVIISKDEQKEFLNGTPIEIAIGYNLDLDIVDGLKIYGSFFDLDFSNIKRIIIKPAEMGIEEYVC